MHIGFLFLSTTFSTCFGAAFFPRNPTVYGGLLLQKLQSSQAKIYLVNTGWYGGSFLCSGKRFDLQVTRKIIDYIHDGTVSASKKEIFSVFDLEIPTALPGIDPALLNPTLAWSDKEAFEKYSALLYKSCHQNFSQYQTEGTSVV